MTHTRLLIGTTKRRSQTAPADVVCAPRTHIGRHLIDAANALAIPLFALAGGAPRSRKPRGTLAANGAGFRVRHPCPTGRPLAHGLRQRAFPPSDPGEQL